MKHLALSCLVFCLASAAQAAGKVDPKQKFPWGNCSPLTPEAVVVGSDLSTKQPAIRADKLALSLTINNELIVDLEGSALLSGGPGQLLIDDKNYKQTYTAEVASQIGSTYSEYAIRNAKGHVNWMRFVVESPDSLQGLAAGGGVEAAILTINTQTTSTNNGREVTRLSSSRYLCQLKKY